MTEAQQREGARQFYYRWNGKGREDEDARSYWIEILTNILGVERVTERVDFEKKVMSFYIVVDYHIKDKEAQKQLLLEDVKQMYPDMDVNIFITIDM